MSYLCVMHGTGKLTGIALKNKNGATVCSTVLIKTWLCFGLWIVFQSWAGRICSPAGSFGPRAWSEDTLCNNLAEASVLIKMKDYLDTPPFCTLP